MSVLYIHQRIGTMSFSINFVSTSIVCSKAIAH